MREVEENIKKKYYRPEIISVEIDVVICDGDPSEQPSEQPPTEPDDPDSPNQGSAS